MTPDLLDVEIAETAAPTNKLLRNPITMHPQLDDLIDVCLRHAVGHIILAGAPSTFCQRIWMAVPGDLLCADAGSSYRIVRNRADALVIEGVSRRSHSRFLQVFSRRKFYLLSRKSLFSSLAVLVGDAVLAYLELGAAGCQLGTLFVCADEPLHMTNSRYSRFIA